MEILKNNYYNYREGKNKNQFQRNKKMKKTADLILAHELSAHIGRTVEILVLDGWNLGQRSF